ncbi:MAG: sulfatase [Verrucomicrobia bacterium]|nr:sulfatase [Verrucomicrobiota bacterium]
MKIVTLFIILFVQLTGTLCAMNKPNVVVFLVDDFSAGALSAYGSDLHETPNIDRLAASGASFTQGYAACTVCSPSRAAILTGKAPARIRLTDWIVGHLSKAKGRKLLLPDWTKFVNHSEETLAEALKSEGYKTGFFGKWHLMPYTNPAIVDQHYPENHGFDLNIGGREWGQPKGEGKYFHPFAMPNMDSQPGDFLTDRLTDYAVGFIEENKEKPFLLYFSYYTVHSPFMGKPDLVKKYREKAAKGDYRQTDPDYAAMVESLDDSVGRVISKLKEEGLADNTLIIFTGDNGSDRHDYTAGLRNCKAYAYEGGVRVPLFVAGLGIPAGQKIDTPAIGMDLYPTILDITGLSLKPSQHVDGISLKPILYGTSEPVDRALFWHYPHYHRTPPYGAVVKDDYKLIEFFEDGSLELYNLKNDPSESTNLSAAQKDLAAELLAELRQWRTHVGAQMMALNPVHSSQPKKE